MPVLRRHAALLTWISVGVLLFSLTIVIALKIGAPAKPVSQFLRQITGGIDKWSLDFMRFIAILAASWIVAVPLARPFAGWPRPLRARRWPRSGAAGCFPLSSA